MTPERQTQVIQVLDEDQAVRLLALMAPDAAADLLGFLKPERAQRLLIGLPEERRSANPSLAGQSVTCTAAVSPVAPATGTLSGTVTFSIEGVSGSPLTLAGGWGSNACRRTGELLDSGIDHQPHPTPSSPHTPAIAVFWGPRRLR